MIYFIRQGDSGPIKIGYTQDIQQRVSALKTGSPFPIVVLHTLDGDRTVEKLFHNMFAAIKVHGEWFGNNEGEQNQILKFISVSKENPRNWMSNVYNKSFSYYNHGFDNIAALRWAVFLDTINTPFEYKRRSVDLYNGHCQPCFYLPLLKSWIITAPFSWKQKSIYWDAIVLATATGDKVYFTQEGSNVPFVKNGLAYQKDGFGVTAAYPLLISGHTSNSRRELDIKKMPLMVRHQLMDVYTQLHKTNFIHDDSFEDIVFGETSTEVNRQIGDFDYLCFDQRDNDNLWFAECPYCGWADFVYSGWLELIAEHDKYCYDMFRSEWLIKKKVSNSDFVGLSERMKHGYDVAMNVFISKPELRRLAPNTPDSDMLDFTVEQMPDELEEDLWRYVDEFRGENES